MILDSIACLKTNPEALGKLKLLAKRQMTKEEMQAQTISFIIGQTNTKLSRMQIAEALGFSEKCIRSEYE